MQPTGTIRAPVDPDYFIVAPLRTRLCFTRHPVYVRVSRVVSLPSVCCRYTVPVPDKYSGVEVFSILHSDGTLKLGWLTAITHSVVCILCK